MLPMPRIVRPDPCRIRQAEIGSPVEPATRRSIKRDKELAEVSNRRLPASSRTRYYIVDLRVKMRFPEIRRSQCSKKALVTDRASDEQSQFHARWLT